VVARVTEREMGPTIGDSFELAGALAGIPVPDLNSSFKKRSADDGHVGCSFQGPNRRASHNPVSVEGSSASAKDHSSAVRQADAILFKAALPRLTFSRIAEALAVLMNGFGS
jgi:hypothetical protein